MKKNKLVKSLVALLAIGSLAACGNGKAEKKDTAEEPLKLWTAFANPSSSVSSWKESPFHMGLEKETGIKIDWEYPSEGTDPTQAFNLMLSEKNLPDIIWYYVMNDADSYMDDGIIQDLTDILPEKAPNYWKFLQEHPDFDRAMKSDSGRYYGFGFFRGDPIQSTYMGPMIRQDWLDEQNLEQPTNAEEWENALTKLKEAYGAQMSFLPAKRMQPGFAGAFGAYGSFAASYYQKNGNVELAQVQPEWKEYMAWLNKLYEKQLIDPDVITMVEDSDVNTKIANDKVSATFSASSQLTLINADAVSNGSTAKWVGIQYPNQSNGEKSSYIFSEDMLQNHVATISSACTGERMEEALKWLDWAYSEEGYYYWNFGTEGVSYEMKDGTPTFTDKVTKDPLGISNGVGLYTGTTGAGLGTQAIEATRQRFDKPTVEAMEHWYNNNQEARASILPAALTLTTEESKESATIENTINTYILENSLKFMTGERSLDEFDSFVKEIEDYNLDRLLEIKQGALERYEKR